MLMALVLLTFIYFLGSRIEKCLACCFPSLMIGDIELDESIENYWASLDKQDRKWSQREEENARNLLTT